MVRSHGSIDLCLIAQKNINDYFLFYFFLKLNCLFWSLHLYIVNVKKRPTKPWRLIQHRLMPFYQVFGVLQDKRETLSIQIYAGFSRLLAQSASSHALVVLKPSHNWCPHATLLAILNTMTRFQYPKPISINGYALISIVLHTFKLPITFSVIVRLLAHFASLHQVLPYFKN